MRKNRIGTLFQFILTSIVLIILGIIIITTLELFEIIHIPEKYSLLKFFPSNIEISVNEYSNYIENTITEKKDNAVIMENEMPKNSSSTDILNKIQSAEKNGENNTIIENKYYYSLLNEYGKIIYNKISQNSEKLKTGTYKFEFGDSFSDLLEQENGNKILENAFQSALNAYIYDNPGVFYIDIGKMYLYTETKTIILKKIYNVYIGPEKEKNYFNNAFNSKEEVEAAIKQVDQIIENLKLNIAGSDYTKIKFVHDYLIDTIEYDKSLSKSNIYNIYGALINKETVCEGYTKAFKYILDEIGIENIFVFGIGINKEGQQENHSWNYVKMENEWYAVDVTWDDPIIIGGSLTNKYRYRYFLKGSNTLFKDHKEDGKITEGVEFYYPIICQNDYNY